jgi:hypothetical protein
MPYVKNTSDQAARVPTGDRGLLKRVPAGAVVELSEDEHKAAKGNPLLESASKEDYDAQAVKRTGDSRDTARYQKLATTLADARAQAVSVPLNEVVGDSDAPQGPASGTITTKQAVARQGVEERRAFADHEALPEDEKDESKSAVHRAQARNKAKTEKLTNEAQADAGSAVASTPESEPVPASPSPKKS